MDMNNVNIEEIVKQVLAGMAGTAPAASASAAPVAPAAAPAGAIPKTAHVAVLTEKEHFDIKEYPIPALGDDDILVKVEGCGVCGTDAHEFKRDPFNLIPVALGHEGTGEIVAMGKNVKTDTAGKPVKIGDKVVTCMIFKDDPEITMFDLNKKNVGGADVYGLLPDDDIHLNGWFSDYIFIRGGEFGSTFFNVSDLDLDSRILIEPCAVLVHAVERAKTTGILRFNSRVVVQGCGPIGLICIAVLRTMGIENICAVDGNQQRLDFAKKMGATMSVNFMEHKGIEALSEAVKDQFGGHLADFAFQCTGNPHAHANIYKFIPVPRIFYGRGWIFDSVLIKNIFIVIKKHQLIGKSKSVNLSVLSPDCNRIQLFPDCAVCNRIIQTVQQPCVCVFNYICFRHIADIRQIIRRSQCRNRSCNRTVCWNHCLFDLNTRVALFICRAGRFNNRLLCIIRIIKKFNLCLSVCQYSHPISAKYRNSHCCCHKKR